MSTKVISVFTAFAFLLILSSFVISYSSDETKQENKIESKIVYNKKHSITLSWPAFGSSGNYVITRGGSRLASDFVSVGSTSQLTFTDNKPNADKYENYYKITRNAITIIVSLENQIFGDNMYFYDRKHEKAETARNEINSHFSTIGLGGSNGEFTTKRQAYYFKPNIDGQTYDSGDRVLHHRQRPTPLNWDSTLTLEVWAKYRQMLNWVLYSPDRTFLVVQMLPVHFGVLWKT